MMRPFIRLWCLFTLILLLAGCTGSDPFSTNEFAPTGSGLNYSAIAGTIPNEPGGNYFIGRRYFKENFYYWGYIREPRQPWKNAKLVMLNEHRQLAPDRVSGNIGGDHNYEYKLSGYFSGDTVYEAASNSFFPEFVVTKFELLSTNPPPLFPDAPRVRGMRPQF